MTVPEVDVRDDGESRYEIMLGDKVAGFARYVRRGGRTFFVHTEIDPRFEGRGLGSQLAAGVLDAERARGVKIVPLCPFVRSFIDRHPGYVDIVDADLLSRIDGE